MAKELKKVYEPQEVEDRLYAHWEELGCFKADNKSKKEPFTVVIPPPNVTGQLHMGHAMDETIQDILIRYKKLQRLRDAVAARHRPRRHCHPD